MAESATGLGGPSLEQILWRAMDRFCEEPALLDAEEFADHVAHAFDGDVPAEAFVQRFFEGSPEVAAVALDMAQAIVRSTRSRLHVYEFDLRQLEYVVLEEKENVVVVSQFGQFSVARDDRARAALEAAVVPDRGGLERRGLDRIGSGPRAYLVRQDGEIVEVDVRKLASAMSALALRQVSAPPVDVPGTRLAPFEPRVRRLSVAREERALRANDRRMSLRLPPPPPRRTDDLDAKAIADARPSTAETAVFVLLPDGSLARPEMGSATRWREMVSDWALRAGLLGMAGRSVSISGSQRFTVDAGKVTAVFTGAGPRLAPGGVAGTAAARSDGLVAARADFAPVRVLADDELAHLVATGTAKVVPGWTAPVSTAAGRQDRYWIQPEAYFAPTERERNAVVQADPTSGLDAPAVPQVVASAEPLQLGQITGDPWADWALRVAQGGEAGALTAKVLRTRTAPREIQLRGEPVVAFRAPDGTLVTSSERGPIRLAALDRNLNPEGVAPDGAARGGAAPAGAVERRLPRLGRGPLAQRAGALPATALAALQLALERTASAGGYKLAVAQLVSAPDAIEAGRALSIPNGDPRRSTVSLAGPATLVDAPGGQVARLVLSMPFPNQGEVHVGSDLSEALTAYLAAPVLPASPAAGAAAGAAGGATLALALRLPQEEVTGLQHSRALAQARQAAAQLSAPGMPSFFGAGQTLSGMPPLLQQAVAAGGDWTPGPGAPMPAAIRQFALRGPFDLPELAFSPATGSEEAPAAPRPLGVGEDEIVIPMPLWAQMGRGRLTATDQVMASPVARTSYAPPLGTYKLVPPSGLRLLDPDVAPPPGTPGVVELAGPTGIRLLPRTEGGGARAHSAGGSFVLGGVPVDDGESVVGRRGRIRVGAPLDPRLVAGLQHGAPLSPVREAQPPLPELPRATLPARPAPAAPPSTGSAGTGLLASAPVSPVAIAAGGVSSSAAAGAPLGSGPLPGATFAAPQVGASPSPGTLPQYASWTAPSVLGVEGLPPGTWSGAQPGTPGYVPWSYAGGSRRPVATSVGGVDLSALARPQYPSLPTGLRFRYVSAPLWWSSALRDGAPGEEEGEPGASARALRLGLRAANSAASLWRSIFVSGAPGAEDLSGGMDRRHDQPPGEISAVERRLDVLVALGLVGGGAAAGAGAVAAGRGPETVYVAMDKQGRAGTATPEQVRRGKALAQAVEMSIVAAIPPSPPPLESMSSSAVPIEAPALARQRHARSQEQKADDSVSHSKIEGSVDAIAQRIYHRIRRRIASDRERFGG